MFCHVGSDKIINVYDVNSTYHVPLLLEEQGMIQTLNFRNQSYCHQFKVQELRYQSVQQRNLLCKNIDSSDKTIEIALVGKYTNPHDSYLSVIKSLEHSCMKYKETEDQLD